MCDSDDKYTCIHWLELILCTKRCPRTPYTMLQVHDARMRVVGCCKREDLVSIRSQSCLSNTQAFPPASIVVPALSPTNTPAALSLYVNCQPRCENVSESGKTCFVGSRFKEPRDIQVEQSKEDENFNWYLPGIDLKVCIWG